MPNWDTINERKRREINLGMAKNGAVLLLKNKTGELQKEYKSTVRLLFILNEELDDELLNSKQEVISCQASHH